MILSAGRSETGVDSCDIVGCKKELPDPPLCPPGRFFFLDHFSATASPVPLCPLSVRMLALPPLTALRGLRAHPFVDLYSARSRASRTTDKVPKCARTSPTIFLVLHVVVPSGSGSRSSPLIVLAYFSLPRFPAYSLSLRPISTHPPLSSSSDHLSAPAPSHHASRYQVPR